MSTISVDRSIRMMRHLFTNTLKPPAFAAVLRNHSGNPNLLNPDGTPSNNTILFAVAFLLQRFGDSWFRYRALNEIITALIPDFERRGLVLRLGIRSKHSKLPIGEEGETIVNQVL
jgi:hypothetical protein